MICLTLGQLIAIIIILIIVFSALLHNAIGLLTASQASQATGMLTTALIIWYVAGFVNDCSGDLVRTYKENE